MNTAIRLVVALPALAAMSAGVEPAAEGEIEPALGGLDRVRKSLVRIWAVTEHPRAGRMEKRISTGSGVIVSEAGDVLTCHRIVSGSRWLTCRLWTGEEVEARRVASDPLSDIALIRIVAAGRPGAEPLVRAVFSNADKPKPGEPVYALGRPAVASYLITQGIISAVDRVLPAFLEGAFAENDETVGAAVPWISHDAAVPPGANGGPLVNLQGEIVGINQVSMGSTALAVPAALARKVLQQLSEQGRVARSWTGIRGQPRPFHPAIDEGMLVGGIVPGSPAASAGLKVGDVVLSFDGQAVQARIHEDVIVFERMEEETPVGKKVEVTVLRDGEKKAFALTTRDRGDAMGQPVEFDDWGMVACDVTPLAAISHQRPDTNGVLVVSVGRESAVSVAQPPIVENSVIHAVGGRTIRCVADLRDALAADDGTRPLAVRFESDGKSMLTLVRIPETAETPTVPSVRRPRLTFDLQAVERDLAETAGMKARGGALVTRVYRGHSADRAGMRPGDLLVALDGAPVVCERPGDLEAIEDRVRHRAIGDVIPVDVLRGDERKTFRLRLEEDPDTAEAKEFYRDRSLELTIETLTAIERIRARMPADVKAVRVVSVEPGGWAELVRIAGGDLVLSINDTPTPDVATARSLLKRAAAAPKERIMFHLRRGVETFYAWVEPHWTAPAVPVHPPAEAR